MKLIVGLGNPGVAYKKTRHNIGFMVLDAFCEKKKWLFTKRTKFRAEEAKDSDIILLKPLTYMNLSGESVRSVKAFYKLSDSDILVVSDDVWLPFGQLRLRHEGSSGGHNGLKNIEQCLQTQQFARLKIGVGQPPPERRLEDYVLSSFSQEEWEGIEALLTRAVDAIESWCQIGASKAMNVVNKPS